MACVLLLTTIAWLAQDIRRHIAASSKNRLPAPNVSRHSAAFHSEMIAGTELESTQCHFASERFVGLWAEAKSNAHITVRKSCMSGPVTQGNGQRGDKRRKKDTEHYRCALDTYFNL